METNEEIVIITETDQSAIYLQDRAMVDVQISTAKAYPRNIRKATENAIAIVTMDKATASTCTYSVPRGGKSITGPSVHLAKILAQVWGNMRCEAKVISHDGKQVTSQAIAFDLESNLAIKVEVKRSIQQNEYKEGKRTGKMTTMADDMIVVTGNAANSIALRNAILSVIPRAIVDKIYNASLQTITGDVSDKNKLLKRRKEVFDALIDSYSVTEKEILSVVGKASINHIVAEDLVVLIGLGQSIKDGDTTVELAFKSNKPKATVAEKKEVIKENSKTNESPKLDLP